MRAARLSLTLFFASLVFAAAEDLPAGYTPELRPTLQSIAAEFWRPDVSAAELDHYIRSCTFEQRDLDRDSQSELVVTPTLERGKKGNGYFFILARAASGWRLIASLEGRDFALLPCERGFPDIKTTWYDGGPKYTETIYRYSGMRYEVHSSKNLELQ